MIRFVVGHGRYVRQVNVPLWVIALASGATILLGLLLLAFIASLAAIVIPVCLLGAGAAHWFGRSGNASREPMFSRRRSADPNIIEGEYRVIDEKRR